MSPTSSSHLDSIKSMIATDCSCVASDERIATQFPKQNHRKSIFEGPTFPINVGIFFCLVAIDIVELLEIEPEVASHVVAQCMEAFNYTFYEILTGAIHPSAQRSVGNVSNPSERHKLRISLIPFWHSGISAKEVSPVDFVYALSKIIHQNPESTGATLPIALSPKSATNVSVFLTGSCNTLKLAGITPSPNWNRSIFFSHD
ncbi:ribosome-recycling factor [Striga asiatica]|uniref:Ribosome-recycling factor n=1 Tax=Striga asiatica TaxID=4170 RepID=A0A5A7RBW2_STRAF|nr:ribosome-recycling factor [Striga asiatica]